jgi:hypothetical protein
MSCNELLSDDCWGSLFLTKEGVMKKLIVLAAVALVGFAAAPAFAAPKTYQVTGPVIEMTADSMVVQKGKEKWEIARGTAMVPDTVKVGSKVMIEYFMTAKSVADKDTKPAATTPAKKK